MPSALVYSRMACESASVLALYLVHELASSFTSVPSTVFIKSNPGSCAAVSVTARCLALTSFTTNCAEDVTGLNVSVSSHAFVPSVNSSVTRPSFSARAFTIPLYSVASFAAASSTPHRAVPVVVTAAVCVGEAAPRTMFILLNNSAACVSSTFAVSVSGCASAVPSRSENNLASSAVFVAISVTFLSFTLRAVYTSPIFVRFSSAVAVGERGIPVTAIYASAMRALNETGCGSVGSALRYAIPLDCSSGFASSHSHPVFAASAAIATAESVIFVDIFFRAIICLQICN